VSNLKLKERAIGIIRKITGASYEIALETLEKSGLQVKTAIVMIKRETTKEEAEKLLTEANGYVKIAIQQ
jgi:N-acetylmuramic acid 6-phosphate etherase